MTLVAAQRSMNTLHLKVLVRKACSCKGIVCMTLRAVSRITCMLLAVLVSMTGITVIIRYPRHLAWILPVRMTLVAAQ
jgi:hypothetical protein